MKAAPIADDFAEAHEPHWVLKNAFQLLVFGLVLTEALLGLALRQGLTWIAVLLVIVAAHFMHGALIGLHEAAHGLLRRNRRFNEFDGIVIGILSLTGFFAKRVPSRDLSWEPWPARTRAVRGRAERLVR